MPIWRANWYQQDATSPNQCVVRKGCWPRRGVLGLRSSLPRWWLHGASQPAIIDASPLLEVSWCPVGRHSSLASQTTRLVLDNRQEYCLSKLDYRLAGGNTGAPVHRLALRRPMVRYLAAKSDMKVPFSTEDVPEVRHYHHHHPPDHPLLPSAIKFIAMPIESRFSVDVPLCSIQQWIFGSSDRTLPDCKAWIDTENSTRFVTLSEARALAKRIAVGLRAQGVRPGDRVLIYSGNSIYFPVLVLGIWMAGCVFTGANPTFTSRELAFQLRDSQAVALFATRQNGKTALEAAHACGLGEASVYMMDQDPIADSDQSRTPPRHIESNSVLRSWTAIIGSKSEGESFQWVEPDDPARTICTLNYSSGTTGLPKGVEITHFNHVANSIAVEKFDALDPRDKSGIVSPASLCVLPMYHAYCQLFYMCNLPRARTPVYVMPSFDFPKFLDHIERYRITSVMAVPPILNLMAKHPLSKKANLSSLLSLGSGAAPLAEQTQRSVQSMLSTEAMVRQGWGMSELTSTGLVWDPRRQINTAVGELIPGNQARLVDVTTGEEITKPDTPGELWIASPTLMRGYWRNPEATAAAISIGRDGTRWFRTGDIVTVDKYGPGALFYMVDRAKELIKVKGFQVAPAELEALLLQRRDVADVAVVGVTVDDRELPRAYVVRAPETKATAAEIESWLAKRVAPHKKLQGGVHFIGAIPKNSAGKILRHALRRMTGGGEGAKPHL